MRLGDLLSHSILWGPVLVFALASSQAIQAAEPSPEPYLRTLYLIRHGSYAPDPKADPKLGPGLTPLGIAQARLVAARLASTSTGFDSMTSSPMTRAKETAAVVHAHLSGVPLDYSADLAECTPPAFRTLEEEKPEEMARCASRIDGVFAERFVPARGARRNEIIVAHGNVIRYLVTKALNVDTKAWLGMSVAHTSLTIIRVRPDGRMSVLAVGDVGHVPPNMQSWGGDADPQLVIPSTR